MFLRDGTYLVGSHTEDSGVLSGEDLGRDTCTAAEARRSRLPGVVTPKLAICGDIATRVDIISRKPRVCAYFLGVARVSSLGFDSMNRLP